MYTLGTRECLFPSSSSPHTHILSILSLSPQASSNGPTLLSPFNGGCCHLPFCMKHSRARLVHPGPIAFAFAFAFAPAMAIVDVSTRLPPSQLRPTSWADVRVESVCALILCCHWGIPLGCICQAPIGTVDHQGARVESPEISTQANHHAFSRVSGESPPFL